MHKILCQGLVFSLFALSACSQTHSGRLLLGREHAQEELKNTQNGHNVVGKGDLIIKHSSTAVSIIEPILFGIYGKQNITKQRPYEIYLIDKHWVISGTLPKDHLGGTFLAIMDARDGRVLKIIHGK